MEFTREWGQKFSIRMIPNCFAMVHSNVAAFYSVHTTIHSTIIDRHAEDEEAVGDLF